METGKLFPALTRVGNLGDRSFVVEKWAQVGFEINPDSIPLSISEWRLLVAQILLWQGRPQLTKSIAFHLVGELDRMGLLVVEALAATTDPDGKPNLNLPDLIVARRLLEGHGLSRQQAEGSLLNLCWVARRVYDHYGVRIRCYPHY